MAMLNNQRVHQNTSNMSMEIHQFDIKKWLHQYIKLVQTCPLSIKKYQKSHGRDSVLIQGWPGLWALWPPALRRAGWSLPLPGPQAQDATRNGTWGMERDVVYVCITIHCIRVRLHYIYIFAYIYTYTYIYTYINIYIYAGYIYI